MVQSIADLSPYLIVFLTCVAFFAGFVDSVAGGGGLLLAPSLMLVGLPAQFALGTNKCIAIFGTGTAMYNYVKNGKMIWNIAIIGAAFSFIGSIIGTRVILHFDEKTAATIVLSILPFTAIITFIPKKIIKSSAAEFSKLDLYLIVPLIGLILGFYDGFFGPGTGTFLIVAFYGLLGMNMINASAVAKVINLASGIGSFLTFAMAGKIIYLLAVPLIFANMAGSFIGSKMAIKKGQSFVRIIIIFAFVILFVSLIVRYIRN